MDGRGYRGEVTLRSPSGESVTMVLAGRRRCYGGVVVDSWRLEDKERDRRFQQLLSAGWKVIACNDQVVGEGEIGGEAGEESKKDAGLVIGTTQSGNASHGGKHASAEVEDSPNLANRGKRLRKCRGGQSRRRASRKHRIHRRKRVRVQNTNQYGSLGVYAPQPLRTNPELLASAEKSAELLAELVGRSHLKVRRGITVNLERLLVALEVGDNPLPSLESPDERPRVKILVTPDCSGSTQDWSGLGQAWALHLSSLPDVDVMYFTNYNGSMWDVEGDAAARKLVESVDVLLYLGDRDGRELCQGYASYGATVLALDSYCANSAKPRLKTEIHGQGVLHWVDRVSAFAADTWTRSIELCLKK